MNLFDFDHTMYRGDASLDFIRFCYRRHPKLLKFLPKQCVHFVAYLLGFMSRTRFKESAFAFLTELPDVAGSVQEFWAIHQRRIMPWFTEYHAAHRTQQLVVMSASPEFLLAPIARTLNVDQLIATPMSELTGKIDGENCRGVEKVRRFHEVFGEQRANDAFSDSLSDEPMLALATNQYMVRRGRVMPLSEFRPSLTQRLFSARFLRFLCVGVVNAGFGVGFAMLFAQLFGQPLLSFTLGYLCTLPISYALNSVFVFRTRSFAWLEFARFCLSYLPNYVIQVIIIFFLTAALKLPTLLSLVLAVAIGVPVTFLLVATYAFVSGTRTKNPEPGE